jgi:hypothetical protein
MLSSLEKGQLDADLGGGVILLCHISCGEQTKIPFACRREGGMLVCSTAFFDNLTK